MSVELVTASTWANVREGVLEIERWAEYALGTDTFRIDHGPDYMRFFTDLGRPFVRIWRERDRVAAVAAAVLRDVPLKNYSVRAWYLCDLKVHPEFRGRNISRRLMLRALPASYLRCRRFYAISMNPPSGPNPVVGLLERFRYLPLRARTEIALWSLDADAARRAEPLLEKYRGPVHYRSLVGIKDIVLGSTGRPMDLLHAQFGPLAREANASIRAGATHMFAVPSRDELARVLTEAGLHPSSSATIIAHGLDETDWRWILTSDI